MTASASSSSRSLHTTAAQVPSRPSMRVTRSSRSTVESAPGGTRRRIWSSKAARTAARSTWNIRAGGAQQGKRLVGPSWECPFMKLLTATREGHGERDGDFCHAVERELVVVGFVCATDQTAADGGRCGCGRAFSGMSSLRGTTTALVRNLDIPDEDLRRAAEAYLTAAGTG